MRRIIGLGIVALIVVGLAVPAAAKATPIGLKGCRLFAAAYNPSRTLNQQTDLAGRALVDFKKVKDAAMHTISRVTGPYPMRSADLGAWCKAHYPKDPDVAAAKWPTGPTG